MANYFVIQFISLLQAVDDLALLVVAHAGHHVYRGGSWWYYGKSCRVTRRNSDVKDIRGVVGVRLAMSK